MRWSTIQTVYTYHEKNTWYTVFVPPPKKSRNEIPVEKFVAIGIGMDKYYCSLPPQKFSDGNIARSPSRMKRARIVVVRVLAAGGGGIGCERRSVAKHVNEQDGRRYFGSGAIIRDAPRWAFCFELSKKCVSPQSGGTQ